MHSTLPAWSLINVGLGLYVQDVGLVN